MIKNLTDVSQHGTMNFTAGGASAIQFYRNNVSITVLTSTGSYVVTVNNWATLQSLYTGFQNSPIDPTTGLNGFDTNFSKLAGEYQATNGVSNGTATTFALLSIFGNSINVYQASNGSTSYVPVSLNGNAVTRHHVRNNKFITLK